LEQILQSPALVLRLASIKSYDEYTLYHSVNVAVISIGLGLVIGPAEELFWRGFVQRRAGYLTATALYGGAHIVTENATLIGAATIAGAYWGLLRAVGVPLGALVVSHVAWDIWIFLIAPTEASGERQPRP